MHRAEADQHRLRLGFRFRLGGCVFPVAPVADYGSENLDALLAPLHETAHFITILFNGMLNRSNRDMGLRFTKLGEDA